MSCRWCHLQNRAHWTPNSNVGWACGEDLRNRVSDIRLANFQRGERPFWVAKGMCSQCIIKEMCYAAVLAKPINTFRASYSNKSAISWKVLVNSFCSWLLGNRWCCSSLFSVLWVALGWLHLIDAFMTMNESALPYFGLISYSYRMQNKTPKPFFGVHHGYSVCSSTGSHTNPI